MPETRRRGDRYEKAAPASSVQKDDETPKRGAGEDEDQQGKKGAGGKKGDQTAGKAPKAPSDLVIRSFAEGKELTIANVVDYVMTRDSRVLVCSIADKDNDNDNGVYAFAASGKKEGGLDKLA